MGGKNSGALPLQVV